MSTLKSDTMKIIDALNLTLEEAETLLHYYDIGIRYICIDGLNVIDLDDILGEYSHMDDFKPSDPEAHDSRLIDSIEQYDSTNADNAQYVPQPERREDQYVYVEFYDILRADDRIAQWEEVEATFKFYGLESAREFINLNGFGKNFKSKYYRIYAMEPTTTYKKVEITREQNSFKH